MGVVLGDWVAGVWVLGIWDWGVVGKKGWNRLELYYGKNGSGAWLYGFCTLAVSK